MKLGKTSYVSTRAEWRKWLEENHEKEPEIWLIYYKQSFSTNKQSLRSSPPKADAGLKKHTGKPRVEYNDAVEEALCFGWIDSTVKTIDQDKYAQRFSPRRGTSNWSEPNKARLRKLIKSGLMTPAGLAVAQGFDYKVVEKSLKISADILKLLKQDKVTWENFQKFPDSYKRIRISWIDGARKRPKEFEKRLNYFLKMTAKNQRCGMLE